MSHYAKTFSEAFDKSHQVSIAHAAKDGKPRNRVRFWVVDIYKDYVVVTDGGKYRSVRYDSIYALTVHA